MSGHYLGELLTTYEPARHSGPFWALALRLHPPQAASARKGPDFSQGDRREGVGAGGGGSKVP